MTIKYKIGNIIGECILYDNEIRTPYNVSKGEEYIAKETAKREKAQTKLFKLLNVKKLQATYNIQ